MPKSKSRSKHKVTWGGCRNERGMTLVFVAMGFMGFIAATMLAIDVGMIMTARNQAQNSADAGALAGAVALGYIDFQDRSAGGPAVTGAITQAKANAVMYKEVDVKPEDVTFPNDPNGQPTRVQVTVHRTAARSNAVSTIIASMFNIQTADISATATAEVSKANAMTCVKPFTVPDKWIEMQTPPWDPDDTFDVCDKKGCPPGGPDIYRGPNHPVEAERTGYRCDYTSCPDLGTRVVLKTDNASKVTPSIYNPILLPNSGTGADDYRYNIAECHSAIFKVNEWMTAEPGNMTGPTKQGIDDLIAKDPNASFNTSTNRVVSSYHPSPRVVAIPIYDPFVYETGKQEGRTADLRVSNFLGFFIEGMVGKEVVGYMTPIGGMRVGTAPGEQTPDAAFPIVIRLVK